jgi:hypothetical protein
MLLLHALATLFMFGVIWVVQRVHYPLMRFVPPERFADFERAHQKAIGPLVGPAMLAEGVTAIALVFVRPPGVALWLVLIGLGLALVNVISTALVQVPCHARLATGWCPRTLRRLVGGNWIRTIAWTLRAAVIMAMLVTWHGGCGM